MKVTDVFGEFALEVLAVVEEGAVVGSGWVSRFLWHGLGLRVRVEGGNWKTGF